jgi:hypothetical protein
LSVEDFCGKSVQKRKETVLLRTIKGQFMDELGLNELQSGGRRSKVNRPLTELQLLVMQAQQEKEKRRFVIATLEALLGRSSGIAGVQELQNERGWLPSSQA